jgi:enoyl-CoA hydratase/carnithine racemase
MDEDPGHGKVTASRWGSIVRLSIDRPEKHNAMRVCEKRALTQHLADAEKSGARAVLLVGAGDRSFCAGSDLDEMSGMSQAQFLEMQDAEAAMYDAMMRCRLPIIAAVKGWALGTGCLLAAVSDFCVADETAVFGQPEVLNGAPTPIHGALLPRLIGLRRARWMTLTGRHLSVDTALAWGLVDEAVAAGQAEESARALAADVALAAHPSSLSLQKRIIDSWVRQPFDGAVEGSKFMAATAYASGWPQSADRRMRQRQPPTTEGRR